MSTQIKKRSDFLFFFLGFFIGAAIFAALAFVATLIMSRLPAAYCVGRGFSGGGSCLAVLPYSLLQAASLGPAGIVPFTQAPFQLTQIQLQAVSAAIYGLLGGILFVLPPAEPRVEFFLGLFALLEVLTAFAILIILLLR